MLFDPYRYEITPWLRFIQRVLLALIVIGLALLATQMFWVPKLVQYLLKQDTTAIVVPSDSEIKKQVPFMVYPVEHASFVAKFGETVIYNDPVGDAARFRDHGPADLLLLTDIHGDHLSTSTIDALVSTGTTIVAPKAVFELLTPKQRERTIVLENEGVAEVTGIKITAIPMYNLPETDTSRHEKGRGNGYVLTQGATDVYVAGDTADISEMRALTSIDYAFIPMNLPYTMSVEAAADAVLAFVPKVVYPYHYRTPEGKSDVYKFKQIVSEGNPEIKVELLPWYTDESGIEAPAPAIEAAGAKIDVRAVCEGALAYTDFASAEAAAGFVTDCIAGKHPEIISRYIDGLGVDGAVI